MRTQAYLLGSAKKPCTRLAEPTLTKGNTPPHTRKDGKTPLWESQPPFVEKRFFMFMHMYTASGALVGEVAEALAHLTPQLTFQPGSTR